MGIQTRNAIKSLVEIKIRLDRGNALIYWLRNIIIMVAGIKYILNLEIIGTIITGIMAIILIFILGKLDLDYFRVMQKEQELLTSKYNPHLNKILKRPFSNREKNLNS